MADKRLDGKNVLLIVPRTQFSEEQVFEPKRILENEGARVVVASGSVGVCRGMRTGVLDSEVLIEDAVAEDYDAVVLAGGSSVPELFWKDKKLQDLVKSAAEAGKVVAAIALSTVVLAKAQLLEGKEATVYHLPEAIKELEQGGATYLGEQLVVRENLITAEGYAAATPFAEAIVGALADPLAPKRTG